MQVQQPVTDKSRRFLNLSGGALLAVVAGVIVLCVVGPFALCIAGGVLGSVGDAAKPKAQVSLSECKIDDSEFLRSAQITYTIKNTGKSQASYRVKFVVLNDAGSQVGDGSAWASNVAGGASKTATETVYLDAAGGSRCQVSGVE